MTRTLAARSLLFAELTRTDLAATRPDARWPSSRSAQRSSTARTCPPARTSSTPNGSPARRRARRPHQIPLVVTPTLPFGSSEHHFPFGGTISLSTTVYYDAVTAIVESLVRDGFRRIFLVNGHGGNHELIQLVARDVALRLPGGRRRIVVVARRLGRDGRGGRARRSAGCPATPAASRRPS